jgi:hypothetical protein
LFFNSTYTVDSIGKEIFLGRDISGTTFCRVEIYRGRLFFRADRSLGAKQEGLTIVHFFLNQSFHVKKLYGLLSNFFLLFLNWIVIFLFKLKGYFLYFTPIVHSMPKLRIHFRLVLIIYWIISLDTCCCLARILRCSLLNTLYFIMKYI